MLMYGSKELGEWVQSLKLDIKLQEQTRSVKKVEEGQKFYVTSEWKGGYRGGRVKRKGRDGEKYHNTT